MFKKSLNRAVLRLKVTTVSPLLIRAGDTGLDPARADLSCVRTRHGAFGETVYVPGSSFKGVLRSSIEALVRGRRFGEVDGACDPLDHKTSCGGRTDNRKAPSTDVHKAHCLACRLFGSTAMKGRCAPRDLFPFPANATPQDADAAGAHAKANLTETRHGVAIDRVAGSVKHGPFDLEMVPAGVSFWGDIALENFQAWQMGLLASGIAELDEGFAQLGSTKSRGLGVVNVAVDHLVIEQPLRAGDRPKGVGRLVDAAEAEAYGLLDEADLPKADHHVRGLSRRFTMADAAADEWLKSTQRALEALA